MNLRDYLTQLSVDPNALAAAMSNPHDTGLDEISRLALRNRSSSAMWDLLLDRTPVTVDSSPPLPVEAQAGLNGARGVLVVIGTGIRTVGQMTVESLAWIKLADVVPYIVADPVAENVIRHLNPSGAISLRGYYGNGVPRKQSYESMIQHILSYVRAGKRTCAAFYGHPGVFAYPSHESIRRARQEGYLAFMLPGVSAEDCLFADLGVDPAVNGCQSFEATDFLLHSRSVDTSSQLILWQVGVLGDWTFQSSGYDLKAMPMLVSRLSALYGPWHQCTLYEAAILPGLPPSITRVPFAQLTVEYVRAGTTMYVPPVRPPTVDWGIASTMNIQC